MDILEKFIEDFGVWETARPYLSFIIENTEMELIIGMDGLAVTLDQAAEVLGISNGQTDIFLERCYSRCIVDKIVENGITKYSPTDFYTRLGHFAKFENWDDIPEGDRRLLDRSFLDQFIVRHQSNVDRKIEGLSAENALPNDTVMLLSEIEEMIDAAADIIVQPCDCRSLGENCDKSLDTCIWLDEGARDALDRGHGRRLSKTEAKQLVRQADKNGLMHTADSEWKSRGLHAICNCCACDCYPFRAAQELGSKGVWPKSQHIAIFDSTLCSFCGTCVERCHFEAFFFDSSTREVEGKIERNVQYDPQKCWGCGLCSSTCPETAIKMEVLQ
ncbi:MAG: 4Fe-4S binding protein [Chloroflexi bacterium]|nr:4Fe-4S binding protein [Chloroflexota bacterium]